MPKKLLLGFLLTVVLFCMGIIFSFPARHSFPDSTFPLVPVIFYLLGFTSLAYSFSQVKKNYKFQKVHSRLIHEEELVSSFPKEVRRAGHEPSSWEFDKKIFDFTPALIAVFDVNSGRYDYVNRASLEILGYRPSEILEGGFQFMLSLIHPDDRDVLLERNNAAIEKANREYPNYDDKQIIEFEYRMQHRNGSYKWMQTYGIIFSRRPDHRVSQVANITIDVSSRKNSEEELRIAQRQLMSLNEELEKKVRERTEEVKLQQQEFRNILMDAPYMISIRRGPELRLDFINKTYEAYAGKLQLGATFEEASTNFKKHKIYEAVWEVYRTGKPYSGQALYAPYDKFRNGKMVDCWFDFTFAPVFDVEGKVDGVATFGFDVTDLILANKEIKKNEDRFRFLANAIPQKVWTATPEGKINYMNEVWAEYTNTPLSVLMNDGWRSILHPDELEETITRWSQALERGHDLEMENRFRNARGEYRWHLVRARAQRDENGKITLWVGTNTDINDNKRIEQDLKISEEYFRQLADQTPFMIWKVDAEGLCNYVNKQWVDYTGLSFSESVGLGWGRAFHPSDSDKEYSKFMKCFRSRKPYHSKFRVRAKDGTYRWFLAESNPLKSGEFSGYIGSLSDINEQELAHQETHSQLEKKDEFMSIASHELKTPISSMKAYLQIAERLAASREFDQLTPFIQKANKQVNKLTGLVENLLDVSRIHAGKMEFNRTVFPIIEAIEDSIEQLHSNNKHEIIIDGCVTRTVNADKYRMEQVIVNLLNNAIKYSPGQEKIYIKCEEVEGKIVFSVTDFGIGIPADKKPYVFERFFRVHDSAQNFSGLGLGLYISSQIIQRHGGEIGVESEEGKGSRFWFSIPMA